jgi:hypothetical protein
MRSAAIRSLTLASLIVTAASASADLTFFGSARANAMGGAGLALVDRSGRNISINPASLAIMNRRVRLPFPSIGIHTEGAISIGKALKYIIRPPDEDEVTDLAREFASKESEVGGHLEWGIRLGHINLSADGVGTARLIPNAPLRQWAADNAPPEALDPLSPSHDPRYDGAQADGLGAAVYSLPTVTVAERVSRRGNPTQIELGARVKFSRGVYSHYIARQGDLLVSSQADPAPEMNGKSRIEKKGLGIDLGVLVHPRDFESGFSSALLVTNLIEPKLRFSGTDEFGNPKDYDLQPRSISVGGAYEKQRLIAALDFVDLNSAYGDPQARLGIEYRTKAISLRGGYSSARGFVVGFGWGYLDVAYGPRVPLEVTHVLRF